MRKALLAGSTSPWLREQATKRAFIRKSVSRFMPGETIDEALQAAKSLQPERITTILTRLGENLTKLDEAEEVTAHYLDVLDRVKRAGLDAQISVKPTQLGLDLDAAVCQRNLDRIVTHAEQAGNTPVWIDMESSPYVDPTLKLFRASREKSARCRAGDAGVPLSHRQGPRRPHSAGPGRSHREGRVSRTAGCGLSRRSRTWTRTSTRCACG